MANLLPEDSQVAASQELLENETKIRSLAISVVRVWSKTFKGNTSWAIVDMIGSALEVYADLLEEDLRVELGVTLPGSGSRPGTAKSGQGQIGRLGEVKVQTPISAASVSG